MINFIDESGFGADVSNSVIYSIFFVSLFIAIGLYLLRSFGLYKLCEKNKVEKKYLAFVPFVWFYLVCMLIKKVKFFGSTFGKLAVLITAVFALSEIIVLVQNFISYFPYICYYLEGGTITIISEVDGITFQAGNNFVNLFDTQFVNGLLKVLYIVDWIFNLANTVIVVFAFFPLFKLYCPERYVLYAIFSVLGLFPVFVFVIRNRKEVNFAEYVKTRFERNNPYGTHQYGNYQNPYGGINNNGNGTGGTGEDPFGYTKTKESDEDEPFSEFNDKR